MKIVWGILEPLQEYQILAKKFNEKLQEENIDVQIEVKLFEKDPENPLKEIEEGNIDLYQIPSTQLRSLLPQHEWLKVWEVPFLFTDKYHVEQYIESHRTLRNLALLETEKLMPLTYSYAGGFCSTVTRRNQQAPESFELKDLKAIEFSKYEYENMSIEDFLINIYQHLPSSILGYEINEMLKLSPEAKAMININTTNHIVVARITMLSKEALAKKAPEFRYQFLTLLYDLLSEEREVIYNRTETNIESLKNDGIIGYNETFTSNDFINELTAVKNMHI